MDRQQMQRCLEQVAAYRTSGQKAKVWAQANGVPIRTLASWFAHARRWQARLDGVSPEAPTAFKPSDFVAARAEPAATSASTTTSVRVQWEAPGARLELHWPLAHTRELAALLRELGR